MVNNSICCIAASNKWIEDYHLDGIRFYLDGVNRKYTTKKEWSLNDQLYMLCKRFHFHSEGKSMGLFMVKSQVETLGGKISANSLVNKGAEFTLTFVN